MMIWKISSQDDDWDDDGDQHHVFEEDDDQKAHCLRNNLFQTNIRLSQKVHSLKIAQSLGGSGARASLIFTLMLPNYTRCFKSR